MSEETGYTGIKPPLPPPTSGTNLVLSERDRRALAAFPALLAVAKGADLFDTRAELREKLNSLDALFPGWREWTP